MKIGIDIHGVANKHKKFFKEFSKLFVENGHEVHILTGASIKQKSKRGIKTLNEIKEINLTYTHIFSIIDYHDKIGTKITYKDSENPWMDDELWDKTKAEYCKKHNIDIMFDDTVKYGKYFTTPFVHFLSIKSEE